LLSSYRREDKDFAGIKISEIAHSIEEGGERLQTDNAERSFKCSSCGHIFSRGSRNAKECPVCGFTCTLDRCTSIEGASNEGY